MLFQRVHQRARQTASAQLAAAKPDSAPSVQGPDGTSQWPRVTKILLHAHSLVVHQSFVSNRAQHTFSSVYGQSYQQHPARRWIDCA
jgi:hypothetical protein